MTIGQIGKTYCPVDISEDYETSKLFNAQLYAERITQFWGCAKAYIYAREYRHELTADIVTTRYVVSVHQRHELIELGYYEDGLRKRWEERA